MMNLAENRGYFEFRVPSAYENVVQRECSVRLLPGEIAAFDRSWSRDSEVSLNNVLCGTDDTIDASRRFIHTSERLVFIWTDRIVNTTTDIEYEEKNRIVVPV